MLARRLLVPATALLLLACGKSGGNCPGQCTDDTVLPTTTITTDDSSASIASARITGGPCTLVLIRSSGEVGAPVSYGAVQVAYNGPRDTAVPPMCIVELTSASGQVNTLSPKLISQARPETCCPYGSCCLADASVFTHYRVQFDQPTLSVSFPPVPDGGSGQDADDAAPDAPASDEAPPNLDGGSSHIDVLDIVDSADLDSSAIDASTVDAESVDSAEAVDAASGS